MAATTRLITLRVTSSNIRRGERGRSNRCPVALALKRRKFRRVTVCDDWISMDEGPRFLVFYPDEALAMVINHFDKAGEMDPFTLCLKPVSSNDPKHPEHYPEDEDDINDPDYFGGIWGRAYGRFNRVGAGDGHPGVNQA